MYNYTILKNETNGVGKPYQQSIEGKAVGMINDWRYFFDPEYTIGYNVRNRVYKNDYNPFTKGFTKNIPEKTITIEGSTLGYFNTDCELPTNEWSIIFVAKPLPAGSGQASSIIRAINRDQANPDERGFNVAFNSITNDRLTVYKWGSSNPSGSSGYALSTPVPPEKTSKLSLYTITFSIQEGLKIFCDNELLAVNSNYKTPINANYGKGEWVTLINCNGDYGFIGVVGTDISKRENIKYMDNFMQLFNQKYT